MWILLAGIFDLEHGEKYPSNGSWPVPGHEADHDALLAHNLSDALVCTGARHSHPFPRPRTERAGQLLHDLRRRGRLFMSCVSSYRKLPWIIKCTGFLLNWLMNGSLDIWLTYMIFFFRCSTFSSWRATRRSMLSTACVVRSWPARKCRAGYVWVIFVILIVFYIVYFISPSNSVQNIGI